MIRPCRGLFRKLQDRSAPKCMRFVHILLRLCNWWGLYFLFFSFFCFALFFVFVTVLFCFSPVCSSHEISHNGGREKNINRLKKMRKKKKIERKKRCKFVTVLVGGICLNPLTLFALKHLPTTEPPYYRPKYFLLDIVVRNRFSKAVSGAG